MEDFTMEKKERTTELCGGIEVPNNDTELVFIIDRSGSMSGFEQDTAGGFNSMIEKQKNSGEGNVYVTTVLFSNRSETVHDRVPIETVEKMTPDDCRGWGSTALLDALGDTIEHICNIHKYVRPEDVPANTIFVITTDGEENASRKYKRARIKEMIEERTEKHGWEFIFVSANIDSEESAAEIGIRAERCASYLQSSEGVSECYAAMDNFVTMHRSCHVDMYDDSWRGNLEKNQKRQKRHKN